MQSQPLQVLLVEDTESDAELLTLSLQRTRVSEFHVTKAETLAQAGQLLDQRDFDVMLLDLSLPDGRGADTFVRARELARNLPIIILTGNEDESIALEALRQGIEDYLVKGEATGEHIARSIRYAIGRAHADKHLGGLTTLLKLFAEGAPRQDYLFSVARFLRQWCGCESVGVRLLESDGQLPYAAQTGFTAPFLEEESRLCLNTGGCACVRVLTGSPRGGDEACVSGGGSFCCNDTRAFVRQLGARPEDCQGIACVKAGYQSLAHAPLRYQGELLGSLHLADRRAGRFPSDTVAFIEAAAVLISEAVHRLDIEDSLAEASERERRLIGQDLHDSLGGELAGAALIAKALARKLGGMPEAELAGELVACINRSIGQTRMLARGLCPVELSGAGLAGALAELAGETQRRSGLSCRFEADKDFRVKDPAVALHLFRLASEAVTNALRHGHPQAIRIRLAAGPTHVSLEVCDDGRGIPTPPPSGSGLGLRTMKYRAESIGARLSIRPGEGGGTVVSCRLDASLLEPAPREPDLGK